MKGNLSVEFDSGYVVLQLSDYNKLRDYKFEALALAERIEKIKKVYDKEEEKLIQRARNNSPYCLNQVAIWGSDIAELVGIDYEKRQKDLEILLGEIRKKNEAN